MTLRERRERRWAEEIRELQAWLDAIERRAIKGGKKMETKPGLKTTEFWLTALLQLMAFVGALMGKIPFDTAVMIAGGGTGAYTISRGIAKNGIKPD